MATSNHRVRLEKVVKERLSSQIIKSIDSLDIEIWEKIESGITLNVSSKFVKIRVCYKIPTKKLLAWAGGIAAICGGGVTVLKWLTPIIIGYFAKAPP